MKFAAFIFALITISIFQWMGMVVYALPVQLTGMNSTAMENKLIAQGDNESIDPSGKNIEESSDPNGTGSISETKGENKAGPEGGIEGRINHEKKKAPIKEEPVKKYEEKGDNKSLLTPAEGRKCYVGFIFGYGGFFPVADYGSSYLPSHLGSFSLPVYYLTLWGICPELNARYSDMKSKNGVFDNKSNIGLLQLFPALMYRHEFRLPAALDRFLIVYGRIWDGVARVHYESRDPYNPYIKKRITEYINTFGISAGCQYDFYRGILIGVDFSYGLIFTAGKPLQNASISMNAGYRI